MTVANIALVGNPNTGKSAIFNKLTGSKQKIGNYPGVTIERKVGYLTLNDGSKVKVIDLPGTYSLSKPSSKDEQITVDILNDPKNPDFPDLIIAIADSTNLDRSLRFILELKHFQIPMIVALNMTDLAKKRKMQLDLDILKNELDVPVIPTIGVKGYKLDDLIAQITPLINMKSSIQETSRIDEVDEKDDLQRMIRLQNEARRILALSQTRVLETDKWTRRFDSLALHPIVGPIFLILIMLLIFQAVFSWSEAPMNLIEYLIESLSNVIATVLPSGLVKDLLVDGIIAGVGSVLVFLPQIVILFFFIYLLENSGYMMRIALMLDKMMVKIGLQGRSVVPLLSSFACAIPGIMATRTIKDPYKRIVTTLIAPLMTCSARLPVYVLLIGAFIPDTHFGGMFSLRGLVMLGLFIAAIFSGIFVALFIKIFTKTNSTPYLIMELPSYKWPDAKHLWIFLWQRTKIFLNRAGKLILVISIALWFLSTFPKAPEDWTEPAITYSFAGKMGKAIEPVLIPLGFDWRIATGLLPGFAAREVMVSAMGTVMAVSDSGDEKQVVQNLSTKLSQEYGIATGIALLVWYIFSPQCLATFAVMRRETAGWKWPIIGFSYMLALAYFGAMIAYQFVTWFIKV